MGITMKKIYVDTSSAAEARREKLNDTVTIGYDVDNKIVGVEITNPISFDIDDSEVVYYETDDNFNFIGNSESEDEFISMDIKNWAQA
tara:strand:- start:748 stop:1011 length:264 start_codon:yes stop_codon:yes gene_type:complete